MSIEINTGQIIKNDDGTGSISYFYSFSNHVSLNYPLTNKQIEEMVNDASDRFKKYMQKTISQLGPHDDFEVKNLNSEIRYRVDRKKWQWLSLPPWRYDGCQIYTSAVLTIKTKEQINRLKIKNSSLVDALKSNQKKVTEMIFDYDHIKYVFKDFKESDFFLREFCYIR